MKPALDIAGLSKRFGTTVAVDNLTLQFPSGELHALLGPNGALIHDPEVPILDEPLTGLDASTARHVKDLLVERARAG